MAKRRRLNPAPFAAPFTSGPAPETKAMPPAAGASPGPAPTPGPGPAAAGPGLAPGLAAAAPIARVAAETAAAAAFDEVAGALAAARAEGRLALRLPLAAVVADHLVRDRVALDDEEMAALMASLAAHGQRTPIDVTDLGDGRYGLISGWRRLSALGRLAAETGEARFAEVLAVVRRPETAAAAYVAMVEENEIRHGLSYYERARIVARAADQGVFGSDREALQTLFAAASRPRRSKIGAFVGIVRALDGVLRFPAAIPERLGLGLAALIEREPGRAGTLAASLAAQPARYPLDELARIDAAVEAAERAAERAAGQVARAAARADPGRDSGRDPGTGGRTEIAPGVRLEVGGPARQPVYRLSGPGLPADFPARLRAWLAGGG
jgi:hypothetical protein